MAFRVRDDFFIKKERNLDLFFIWSRDLNISMGLTTHPTHSLTHSLFGQTRIHGRPHSHRRHRLIFHAVLGHWYIDNNAPPYFTGELLMSGSINEVGVRCFVRERRASFGSGL